jgi:hypothetical protein|tara:strand:- start:2194 stop:2895 length:702 start_codon:yes stop_codon:yes gene_type:complete
MKLIDHYLSLEQIVSDTDSFLQEVSEELRRDRLYRNIRKYGWLAILLVVLVVGGATYREYLKSKTETAAQLFGTSIINALGEKNIDDRISKLQKINAPGDNAKVVIAMLLSAELNGSESPALEKSSLSTITEGSSIDAHYRELLNFKILLGSAETLSLEERATAFEALSKPGNPFRLLAEEQLALIELEQGYIDNAVEKISQILLDAELTAGLRNRATQMMIALGKDPELINN